MADVFHDFPIKVSPAQVFQAVSSPSGLDQWWTRTSRGEPFEGADYELGFGPGYDWRARVTRCAPNTDFELEHYRISNCCWAMYLRILRRYLEYGETVSYEDRLDV